MQEKGNLCINHNLTKILWPQIIYYVLVSFYDCWGEDKKQAFQDLIQNNSSLFAEWKTINRESDWQMDRL